MEFDLTSKKMSYAGSLRLKWSAVWATACFHMRTYQRILTRGFTPFDPLALAEETEQKVTREGPEGLERKYTGIYSAPVYGGIATGYAVGCCLRCIYCWSNWSRDFPERFGRFYSPEKVAKALKEYVDNLDKNELQHTPADDVIKGLQKIVGEEWATNDPVIITSYIRIWINPLNFIKY